MSKLLIDKFNINNLLKSFENCKKESQWKTSVQQFECHKLSECAILCEEIKNHTYKPMPFYEFDINERGKHRHIKANHIRDRVVQRCLCDEIITPRISRYLIKENCASQINKGLMMQRRIFKEHLASFLRKHDNGYILKIDIENYFGSIPHNLAIKDLEDLFEDDSINWLIEEIINQFDGDIGVGIGSHISQQLAIYYVRRIDTYCKCVRGHKYYGRYMDDIYVIDDSKERLKETLAGIKQVCDELGLKISDRKTQIIKLTKGFVFLKVKYRIDGRKIICTMSPDTITRERRKLKKYAKRVKNHQMSIDDFKHSYRCWRESKKEYKCYRSLKNMDELYKALLKELKNETENFGFD